MEILQQQVQRSRINPFRPGSGLYPSCLAGRRLDTELYASRLYSTITGTPKNILIYGEKQMGKTSLLMRFERIAEEKKMLNISALASPMPASDFLMNVVMQTIRILRQQEIVIGNELDTLLQVFQTTDHDHIHKTELAFTEFLIMMWEYIKDTIPSVVFSIDDLDLVEMPEKALMLLQNVTKKLYRSNCPIIFVLTASAQFYETINKTNKELAQYFEPIHVGRLQQSSCINAVRVPLWEQGIQFDEEVIKEIARRSDGFPFYLQQIAHHVFEEAHEDFDTLALRRGYERAIQALERELFIPMYMNISPVEARLYLEIFRKRSISFTEVLKQVKMPKGSVASSLKRLREKQLIQQTGDKKYSVNDRLFGAYLEKRMQMESR